MHQRPAARSRAHGYAIPLLAALPLVLSSASTSVMPGADGAAEIPVQVLQPVTGALTAPQPELLGPTAATLDVPLPGEGGSPATVTVTSPKGARTVTESGIGVHDIPSTAVAAYQRAAAVMAEVDPGCRIPWTLIAAIGRVESNHGRYGGSVLGSDGVARPAILGLPLNGVGPVAEIHDTDDGRLDQDTVWDRAVGPMQFIPSTWAAAGVDGDGDDVRSPHDIDDAALAAAVYLCAGTSNLIDPEQMDAAIHRYNNADSYTALVMAYEQSYRTGDFTVTTPTTTTPGSAEFDAGGAAKPTPDATKDAVKASATVKKDRKDAGDVDMTGTPIHPPATGGKSTDGDPATPAQTPAGNPSPVPTGPTLPGVPRPEPPTTESPTTGPSTGPTTGPFPGPTGPTTGPLPGPSTGTDNGPVLPPTSGPSTTPSDTPSGGTTGTPPTTGGASTGGPTGSPSGGGTSAPDGSTDPAGGAGGAGGAGDAGTGGAGDAGGATGGAGGADGAAGGADGGAGGADGGDTTGGTQTPAPDQTDGGTESADPSPAADPDPAPSDPGTSSSTDTSASGAVDESGTLSTCAAGYCLDGQALDVGSAESLATAANSDFDGNQTTGTNREELDGLVGKTVSLTVEKQASGWVVVKIGEVVF